MTNPSRILWHFTAVLTVAAIGGFLLFGQTQWKIHDMDRPQPRVIEPATASTQDQAGRPPSDAIVLFNGKDLSQWRGEKQDATGWKVENNYMETVKGTGMLFTRQPFGDCQLHIEWATPSPASGDGQGRGNSGVYLMGQIRDSGPRFLPEQDLPGRAGGRDLRPVPTAGERFAQARRVADVRRDLPRTTL